MPTDPKVNLLKGLAINAAQKQNLQESLVCAICDHESVWNPWAIRYEPAFYNKYILPEYTAGKFLITEAKARSISWGLMQVMGEVAREFGFTGDLPSLCDPFAGLDVGCRIFAHKLYISGADVTKGLQAYNGGANPNYAAEVLALQPKYAPSHA